MTEKPENPQSWMDHNVNSFSPSFCGAKWYNATVWLGNGMTASCHHPPPHRVDPEEVKTNPSALHNTQYKKLVRQEMQSGVKTRECDYCWKIEGMGSDYVSDRYYKSKIYSQEDLVSAYNSHWTTDVTPKTLEIAFDNNCNFACSYCNAGFSTTWAHDINKHGAYQNLNSEGWGAFGHNGDWAHPYGPKNQGNPYIAAFWQWWEEALQHELEQLRVTGGEATVSKDFWKLIDWYEAHPNCDVKLGVNTNLGVRAWALNRLITASKFINNFELYTSNEAVGIQAEYIRDGLEWKPWIQNLEHVMQHGAFTSVHVMMTLNALCLGSLDKFHEEIFRIRESNTKVDLTVSYNILRFPSFQSITTLPEHIRTERAAFYTTWMQQNQHRMTNHEVYGMQRLIAYTEKILQGHDVQQLSEIDIRQKDFKSFFQQYDQRRDKNFHQAFGDWPDLVEWYDSIDISNHVRDVPELIDADAVNWGEEIRDEVFRNAVTVGLIDDNDKI